MGLYHDKKILFESVRKYWFLIALTVGFSLLAAVFEAFGVGLLIPFLRSITDSTDSVFATGVVWVDRWILATEAAQIDRIYRICGIILAATLLRCGFGYLSSVNAMKSRALVVEDLRMRIIDQLQDVSLSFFSKTRSGELINTLTNELGRVSHSIQVVMSVISRGFLFLVYTAFMIYVSWELSLIVVGFFAILSLLLTRLITIIRRSGAKVTRANGELTSSAAEFISGIRTVVACNMQAFERERLQGRTNDLANAIIETSQRDLAVQPISQAVVSTVLIGVILVATQFYILPGRLDVALLLTFLFALLRLVPILHTLNTFRAQWASLRASVSNVQNLLQRDDKPYLTDGLSHTEKLQEGIRFDNISFAYEPGQEVLSDISIFIEAGKTTAFVGASGAGKTTLADLIPRFYDPTEGRILMDGVDVRTFELKSLRQKIGIVSQDTFLFHDTVYANIAYGTPGATLDQIIDAAEKANATEFIQELPNGFDTILGDRGITISGGQRQRVAIARAVLQDPDILILDEATSALDSISERLVQQSLEDLMQGRTVIAIAHRLSTIKNADKIIVLEEGRVAEQGTYDELLARKGFLWNYYSIQFQAA